MRTMKMVFKVVLCLCGILTIWGLWANSVVVKVDGLGLEKMVCDYKYQWTRYDTDIWYGDTDVTVEDDEENARIWKEAGVKVVLLISVALVVLIAQLAASGLIFIDNKKMAVFNLLAGLMQLIYGVIIFSTAAKLRELCVKNGILDYFGASGSIEVGIGAKVLIVVGVTEILIAIIYLCLVKEEGFSHVTAETKESVGNHSEAAPSSGAMICVKGDFSGASFPIGSDMVLIGRNGAVCNVVLGGAGVSRRHCGIKYDALHGVYQVYDYSSNGTFQEGGARLRQGANELIRGSSIRIGENVFTLQ